MKKLLLTVLIATSVVSLCSSQQNYYDVTAGNGYGVRFWGGSDYYKVHFGNTNEYHFGPVTDYSIKMNMSSDAGRGWTWGLPGSTPVAALGNQGNMQIASSFMSGGNIINNNTANGWIGLTGDLPGYANGSYPTLKTNGNYLYFSTSGIYSAYLGGNTFSLLDASTSVKVQVNANGSSYFNGGNLGIGTSGPDYKLHIKDGVGGAQLKFQRGTGIATVLQDNNTSNLYIEANSGLLLNSLGGGYVGIGTTSPDYPLTVKGSIHAKEVRVDLTGALSVPDYVFEKDYKLASLEEIKTYIDQNKHLPEVPSGKEIEKNGVQLGEMNMILLKKIEELTLYVIALKRENEAQNQVIDQLKKQK